MYNYNYGRHEMEVREMFLDGRLEYTEDGHILRHKGIVTKSKGKSVYELKEPRRIDRKERNGGYYVFTVQLKAGNKQLAVIRVHRMGWCLKTGCAIPEDMIVAHADDDPSNNRLDNLELITQSQNIKDAFARNRKLNPHDIGKRYSLSTKMEMKRMRETGMTYESIAKHFGCDLSYCRKICKKDFSKYKQI